MKTRIEASADVEAGVVLSDGVKIWHLAQVRANARLGQNVIVGRGAYVGPDVTIGDNCKIQNYALVYEPAILYEGVFIGPAAILTNDTYPRAVNPDLTHKEPSDWTPVGVTVEEGASIGARAVCVAPVRVGAWSTVAAGAVVINDVPNFALVAGTPARQIGWVGKSGHPLVRLGEDAWLDETTGERFSEVNGKLKEQ